MKVLTPGGHLEQIASAGSAQDFLNGLAPTQQFHSVPLIKKGRSYLDNAQWVDYSSIYRTNPWLFAVVNLIGRSSSRMPVVVTEPDDNGLRRLVTPGEATESARFARALLKPGRGVSWQAQHYGTTIDRLVRGNALWKIEGRALAVDGFTRIPWKHVSAAERGGEMVYLDHRRDVDGVLDPKVLRNDEVIHFGYWADSDEAVNTSAISTLHATLALFDAVYRHLVSYFAHSTRPSGHYEVDPKTSDATLKRMMAVIRVAYAGPDNAGRPTVSSGKYHPSTASPDESKVVELAKQSREEIVAAFGVAPPLVGILDRAIMSNVKELREHTVRDTTGPHLELLAGDIQAQGVETRPQLDAAGVLVEFDFMRQLRPSPEAAADMIPNELRIRTPNEMRGDRGWSPLDDPRANELWFPNDSTPDPDAKPDDDPAPEVDPDDEDED